MTKKIYLTRPCQLQDAIQVVESSNPQEKAMFAAQAAKDWYTILLHRAQELVPGIDQATVNT